MAIGTVSNTGGNWSSTSSWVLGAVPAITDSITFTTSSGPLVVNVGSTCSSINFSNYRNAITFTSNLTVNGNITLYSGVTFSGPNGITVAGTSTLTSNGVYWNNPFLLSSSTLNLADYWHFNSLTIKDSSVITFTGSNGFIVGTFSMLNTTGATHTFHSGNTYTITSFIGATSLPGITRLSGPQRINIVSSTPGSFSNITLAYGGSSNLSYVIFKDINAIGGRRIWTWGSDGRYISPNGSSWDLANSNVINISGYFDIKTIGL